MNAIDDIGRADTGQIRATPDDVGREEFGPIAVEYQELKGGEGQGVGPVEAVFAELFHTAYIVAYRILGNVADAEDAAAEAIARACFRWGRVGALPHRQAWVARVAANVAIDAVRKRRRAVVTSQSSVLESVRDQGEAAVLRVALVAALAGLSSRQREVVVLRYLADQPEAEVASLLGISINTVKKHTLRGVAALRQRLGPTWEDVDVVWT